MKVFVSGATGKQGGGAARALLEAGATVHALTRDVTSEAAQALFSKGAVLFQGDAANPEALKPAIEGVDGVFLLPMISLSAPEEELRFAKNIIKVAQEVGTVKHIITTTVFGTDRITEIPGWDAHPFAKTYWESKRGVEEAVRTSGTKYWTIFKGPGFMTNYINPDAQNIAGDLVKTGTLNTVFTPEDKVKLIDPADIGGVAAVAFLDPEKWHAKELNLVADKLASSELVALLAKESGKDLKSEVVDIGEAMKLAANNPFLGGRIMSLNTTRQYGSDYRDKQSEDLLAGAGYKLKTFAEFLADHREEVKSTYAALPQ